MWTFNNFPSAGVAHMYGFESRTAFLQKIARGSIRLARMVNLFTRRCARAGDDQSSLRALYIASRHTRVEI
jgi:hypothetical protein